MEAFEKNTQEKLALIKSTFEKDNDLPYSVFQQMPIGICITDDKGIFTDVNTTYCDIYGYSRSELLGNPFTTVVPDENRPMLEKMHDDFMSKEYELQGRWTVQDSQKRQFEIITNAVFLKNEATGASKKMTLVVKAMELELTIERLKTTIEILENKIATQDIAARLAEHDMRNRIASMVSISDILAKSKLEPDQAKWVRMLKDIGNDTLKLLTSTKDFAKMERGEYQPEITFFDLVSLIANQTSEMKDLINEKQADFQLVHQGRECDPGTDDIMMYGDKFYLEHLFQNLLRNALEASPDNGLIKIDIDTENLFTVTINNKGVIPSRIRDNFFEKYTTSGKDRGTGLGTYISKMIAEMHRGSLSFLTNEEEGTTLILKLPKDVLTVDKS